ncbi:MAG: hypothetical protein DMF84_10265 [Acidobacteria bacterium]|nr:MAG: hypothetical protein DMF84_10265 [Acidobacteriota bacterium]
MAKRIRVGAWRQIGVRAALAAGLVAFALSGPRQPHVVAASACGPTVNPVACENQNPGDPASQWDVSGAGDTSIQGFATDISVAPGGTELFKIDTSASAYSIDLYRIGYYGGMGARKIATIAPSASLPQNQPNCLTNAASGLIDCGNWAVSASWQVPANAVSGIYFAKLTRNDTGGASHIFFVVRDDAGRSDVLFQTSDTTWQAYNTYGGNSLYQGAPGTSPSRAYKVSYNRPITTRGTGSEDFVFNAEYPMVRWLESNGYDVSYTTGVDTDRRGAELLEHKIFLSNGHDEYWSGSQRANVEAARAAGVNLAFFSGNEVFWKTRWETSIDGSNTSYRTMVCYKETHAGRVLDPADPPTWTGTWRDTRFSPPADGGRPENALTGTIFMVNDGDTGTMLVPAADGKARFWRNTTVATLAAGATATLPSGVLGYEWDADLDNGARPLGLIRLSTTTRNVAGKVLDFGSTFGPGTVTHSLTLYRHASGALVFGAGTVQWAWGLDANHDRAGTAADVRMKQATVNLFADMGVQPTTLQAGLVGASLSTDALAPTSTITSPANGANVTAGSAVTITGTATDAGGGIVSGVEVSVDNGATWRPATGTTSWSFNWVVSGSGTVTIRSRGYDDTGNMETPSAGVAVSVAGTRTCPCSIWASAVVPPAPIDDGDPASVELGTKFRAEINGYITGVRFYKGSANVGNHIGSLWTSTGTLLASVAFSGETASGWQQANFSSAVPVTANTTYVVSYFAPNGHYTGTDPYFTAAVDNPPLHALRDGVDGANGVYVYTGSSAFPNQTFNSENYWADVVFTTTAPVDTTPPTITTTVPVAAATNVDPAAPITATFNEAMDPATISASNSGKEGSAAPGTFELKDNSGVMISATVTYDSTTRVGTLKPVSSLQLGSTYVATVKGGTTDPRVKDAAGNAMAATVTWTFTTWATPPPPVVCPCSIWPSTAVPTPVDDGDPSSVELGTKFRSDVAGFIMGARFYKGALNTGTHAARLWSSTGTQLGVTTFANETASGWQEVAFATPIAIAANTTYVISYHAPNGHYPGPDNYFTNAGLDTPPLHGLRSGVDGANGVYAYGTTSVFPTNTFIGEAYFVDVVFNTTTAPDTTPPAVSMVTPPPNVSGVRTNTTVTATFNEPLNSTTITTTSFLLRNPSGSAVPATVSYDAGSRTATLTPSAALGNSVLYTAVVKAGVKDAAGNAIASDYSWTFTTAAPPPPPPTQGPGGPVLVVTSAGNPHSTYYAEILRTEGLNAFATADLSTVTSATLGGYDLVVLGDTPLTAAQVSMFTDWVTAGGNLIAMRPDKQLAGLLGLTDAASTLANAYLLVNTASSPGAGIVGETIQFHGTADRYTLNGATAVATLYSTATAATVNPAVTMKQVGSGTAAAFTYDLARSVVQTRQGNPAWSGQERDAQAPIRSDDLYFGAKAGDVQPDWIDFSKVAIPQADEQQRLLWNIILKANANKKPLPRFWYYPRMLKAVVIMTGDDHANGGTAGRFDTYLANSPVGCSVANWECIRGTSYIFSNTPLPDTGAANYVAQGFEVALHLNTNCGDWTPATLASFYNTQLTQFSGAYPHVPAPATNRMHCIVWSDYATQPQVELNSGIRLDTSYYYWPSTWVQDRPGLFTGSGMPMRFATSTGQVIDVYQAPTQMTDESGQTYTSTINTLLDNALGPLGYYGTVTANMHTDFNPSEGATGSAAIVASAKARGVPVIAAKQMLDWLDGRNSSTFSSIGWSANVLSFTIGVGAGATGLQAMVPASVGISPINNVTLNGAPVTFTTQTIKGIAYAIFPAGAGVYAVTYGADTTAPTITNVIASPSLNTALVTWTTNELSDSRITYGTDPAQLISSVSNATGVTSHNLSVASLAPNTPYFYRVSSSDAAANTAVQPVTGSPASSFTTAGATVSGQIAPVAGCTGATLTLSGAVTATAVADGSGNYAFSGLSNGSYTVEAARNGCTFNPASQPVTIAGSSVTGANFTAQAVTISGTISPAAIGSGATVTLSGAASAVTTTDASGNYSFSGMLDGAYTITPSKSGFTFTPANRSIGVARANVTGVNFTGQAIPTFNVSGTISGGAGATVNLSGAAAATTTADAAGHYSFTGLLDGNYTVTPVKTGFTLAPASAAVTIAGASAVADFSAVPVVISGTITPASIGSGATVTLSGAASAVVTADASGAYSFSGITDGSYTVTAAKSGFTFTPASRAVTVAGSSVTAADFSGQPVPTFSVSGTIAGGGGTTINLTGAAAASTTADAAGNYTISGLANGSYTLTPVKSGFTFSPANQAVTIASANVSGVNFTAQAVVITGTITPASIGAGATVTLSGAANAVVTADASGNYTFSGIASGSYTVTPAKSGGFTFTPASRAVTVGGVSVTGVNFTGAPPTFTLSGTITGGSAATVNMTGGATRSVTADVLGNYSFTGLVDGQYTITPVKSGFTMTPPNQAVTVTGANVTGVNFVAQAIPTWTISGTITPASVGAGATVTLGGVALTTTADASGNYSFSGLSNGTYTVTPAKAGASFTPVNQSVTVNGTNVTGINFTGVTTIAPISVDANVSLGRSTRSTTITSPAFSTTAGNELLLAFISADNVTTGATTVTGITSTGLTWTLVRRTNAQLGSAEIWRAFAASTVTNLTARATLSQGVAASITVTSFKNVDTTGTNGSGAIGATGSNNSLSGAPTASLTTTRANSLVIGVGSDWDQALDRTVGANQSIVFQFFATDGDTFWVQRQNGLIAQSGTVVTINDTAPATDRFNLTICEVLGALQ